MVITAFILLGAILGFGILFLRLHKLPERIAYRSHKLQLEIAPPWVQGALTRSFSSADAYACGLLDCRFG